MRSRLLILSDTHGDRQRLDAVVQQVGAYDHLLHAGDHADDVLDRHPRAQAVCGNCDAPDSAEPEVELTLHGRKLLLVHGHTLNVKTTALPLLYRAAERQADIVIFGHTHTPTLFVEDGRLFLNPGSLLSPRGYTVPTYAILELTETVASVQVYMLDGQPIPDFQLTHSF